MSTLPSVTEYERMTNQLRHAALELLHEQHAVIHAERTRLADARLASAGAQTAAVVVTARRLLPAIIAVHGDTPALQHSRRADLAADTIAYGESRRNAA